ncbi:chemotaxis protein CheW [Reinekea marinisedimentorum]|uniref:Twitching motility protein PilI n=1 Tax=Reinekea marinisedimentorum TaxID=230495 RepID=A0A4R3IAA1_9GAMM|nr:chemotaxis protein CheW [Reinekea marinisedimentorum]TCS43220.1 twitching motility protein PilI [Reinekea marinisedimentorum]
MADQTPLSLLRKLDSRVRSSAVGLPEQQEIAETWSGIGFRIGGHHFVSPMSEVTELLRVPAYTRLPNVKPWVLGVSNIRGRLIPLIDLGLFLSNETSVPIRSRRILVVEKDEQSDGLVVDGVDGMQYFPIDSYSDQVPDMPESIKPFVSGHFVKDSITWSRFNMGMLTENDKFQDVAG